MGDALGNPLAFSLTPGHAHDLEGADALLPQMKANTLLADKALDADQRVIELLRTVGKTALIPSRSNRKTQRTYDTAACMARHLVTSSRISAASSSNSALSPAAVSWLN
jgi:transposase